MTKGRVRLLLLLDAAAVAAVAFAVLLALGLPAAGAGALRPPAFVVIAAVSAAAALVAGAALLVRWVARPLDRLFRAAARLEAGTRGDDLPLIADRAGGGFGTAAVAFERAVEALDAERARLAAKVTELSTANRELASARESLLVSERLATVGRLAAGVAHEIGNPLGAITAYAELARSRLPASDGEARDYLSRIAVEAGRIDAIVRDLLDFARPASLRLEPVALDVAVGAALETVRVQARFREVEVALDLPRSLPRVHADERRTAQVLVNLLLNAADAMGGAGRILVRARAVEGGVELVVVDHGPGIRAADLPRVFDPFFTTKEPGQGTGLGLAVCHGIMESFGGTIRAASLPEGGAAFTLSFRLASPRTAAATC